MTRLAFLLCLMSAACGPATISPQPIRGRTTVVSDAVYFWQVKTSTLEWGACADAEDFRSSASALPIGMNNFLIYRTDASGTKARAQTCPALEPSTCRDSTSGIVFDVAGTELVFTRPLLREPLRVRDGSGVVRDSPCQLSQLETWTVRDNGLTFELEVTSTLDLLEPDPPSGECKQVEDDLIARSPNMMGIRGCVITFRLGGDLR
jgi:hypothetical protein